MRLASVSTPQLAVRACVLALVVACGCGSDPKAAAPGAGTPDAGAGAQVCDPIKQAGCGTGQKCTWIFNTASTGVVGCEPDGSVALAGECTFGTGGTPQFPQADNCKAGNICVSGKCETICSASSCGTGSACALNPPLFTVNGAATAGACGKTCDPLADNRFGSGAPGDPIAPKTGSACAAGEGCYGTPSEITGQPVQFVCMPERNPGLVHRSSCTVANGCQPDETSVYVNGCAQGYLPLEFTIVGGAAIQICAALCQPHDCYAGNCGSDNLASMGSGTHQCAPSYVRTEPGGANNGSAYAFPTAANGGDPFASSCYYWWSTDIDINGVEHPSPFDDTIGLCLDHSKYFFDPTGGMNPTTPWPDCKTLPGSGTGGIAGSNAADWACVSRATAAALGDGLVERKPVIRRPRLTGSGMEQLMRMRPAQ
jgi:hypothetical protein